MRSGRGCTSANARRAVSGGDCCVLLLLCGAAVAATRGGVAGSCCCGRCWCCAVGASGSGSTALTFSYTILAGQTDINGISIDGNSLNLNGGTIKDASGNSATLTHSAVTDNASYMVDTTAPTATLTSGT